MGERKKGKGERESISKEREHDSVLFFHATTQRKQLFFKVGFPPFPAVNTFNTNGGNHSIQTIAN